METQRVLELYQNKISKLESLIKLKNEFIKLLVERDYEMSKPFIFNEDTISVFSKIGEEIEILREKISELEKELNN